MESVNRIEEGGNESSGEAESSKSFDRLLSAVGPGGKYQWRIFFICSFCGIFTAMQSLSAGIKKELYRFKSTDLRYTSCICSLFSRIS